MCATALFVNVHAHVLRGGYLLHQSTPLQHNDFIAVGEAFPCYGDGDDGVCVCAEATSFTLNQLRAFLRL